MNEQKKVAEVKENWHIRGDARGSRGEAKSSQVAAFFDLDGTLIPGPSLETRLFRALRRNGAIARKNYLLWMREALRLLPAGVCQALYANKMYLRGVRDFHPHEAFRGDKKLGSSSGVDFLADEPSRSFNTAGVYSEAMYCTAEARSCLAYSSLAASAHGGPHPGKREPFFFVDALERVAWHAREGHAIVLVTGTLQPLAREAAMALALQLALRGISGSVAFLATRLETRASVWSGRIVGEAMFGEEKARAVRQMALERGFDLDRCFAYGDSAYDRWMLEAVGRPVAVNPADDLARIARRNGWPILPWKEQGISAKRPEHRARSCRDSATSHRDSAERRDVVFRAELRCDELLGAEPRRDELRCAEMPSAGEEAAVLRGRGAKIGSAQIQKRRET